MLKRVVTALLFFAFLYLVWGWLDRAQMAPPPNVVTLNGWVYAAYAFVIVCLAGYRGWMRDRERAALRERFELARRLGDAAAVPPGGGSGGLLEQLAFGALLVGLVLATLYAPEETTMGQLQRIFYVHVPSAWVAFLAFGVVFAGSIAYLGTRRIGADRLARSSAEVGVMFTTIVLVTGPIWGKPAWGIWWTWDARLTTTLVLWLLYIGYLMLRAYLPDAERRATLAAVVGILGFVGVPIDYMAIRWWRTQHPAPVMAGGAGSGLHPQMLRAFLFMLLAFTLLYAALLRDRIEVDRLESDNEDLQRRLS
jgi:heme exporter protein C